MSQALAYDTSTWSKQGRRMGTLGRVHARDFRETDDFFVDIYSGGRGGHGTVVSGSAMEFRHGPGVALGLTPPSVLKEREKKTKDFVTAVEAGVRLAVDMVTADEIDLHDFDLWKSAIIKLSPYVGLISAPLVHPLQLGGVSFEWHESGMNVELRFRGERDIFVVIEDANREIQEFLGQDPFLLKAGQALQMLIRRQA